MFVDRELVPVAVVASDALDVLRKIADQVVRLQASSDLSHIDAIKNDLAQMSEPMVIALMWMQPPRKGSC